MRQYIITALVLLSAFASALDVSAQNMKVTGTVFDNEGQSLPGAYVIRYDASKANILESVMVDIDGKFSINAAKGDILEFSFIGFEKKSEAVGSKAVFDIILYPDSSLKLEESVVIGYGSVQRGDLTGSVTNVRMGDINDVTHPSVDAALDRKSVV